MELRILRDIKNQIKGDNGKKRNEMKMRGQVRLETDSASSISSRISSLSWGAAFVHLRLRHKIKIFLQILLWPFSITVVIMKKVI